jgi:hypothetical protein
LSCILDGTSTVVASGSGAGPHSVSVDPDTEVICVLTNTRLSANAPSIALTPANATNDVGDSHCLTAIMVDSSGRPLAGQSVVFSVTGTVTKGETITTGADGRARFCYEATSKAGNDSIRACVSDPPVCASAINKWEARSSKRRPTLTPTPTATATPTPTAKPLPTPTRGPAGNIGAIIGGVRQTPVVAPPPPPLAPNQAPLIRPPNTGDGGLVPSTRSQGGTRSRGSALQYRIEPQQGGLSVAVAAYQPWLRDQGRLALQASRRSAFAISHQVEQHGPQMLANLGVDLSPAV